MIWAAYTLHQQQVLESSKESRVVFRSQENTTRVILAKQIAINTPPPKITVHANK